MDWCFYYVAVWADKKHTVWYVIHVKIKKSFSAYRLFIFCSSQLHLLELVGARSLCWELPPELQPLLPPCPDRSCSCLRDILYFGTSVHCTILINVLKLVWDNVGAFPRSFCRNVSSLPILWSKLERDWKAQDSWLWPLLRTAMAPGSTSGWSPISFLTQKAAAGHDGWWKACCDLLYFPDPFGKPTFRKNSACSACIRVPDHSCPCTTLRWSPSSFNPQNISLVVKFVLILNPISIITAAFAVLHYQQISSCIFYSIIRIVSDNIERTRTAPCSHLSALKICETRFVLILQEFQLVCLWECTRQKCHWSPRIPTSTAFCLFLSSFSLSWK